MRSTPVVTTPSVPLSFHKRFILNLATFLRHWVVVITAIAVVNACKSGGELVPTMADAALVLSSMAVLSSAHQYIMKYISRDERQQVSPYETSFYIMAGVMVPFTFVIFALT